MNKMKTCEIEECDRKYYAKQLCLKHYGKRFYQKLKNDNPEKYKKRLAYVREYNKRPKTKALRKKYYQKPEVKERIKKYQQEHSTHYLHDFFDHFKRIAGWREAGVEKMAKVFSETVCELTNKQQCELEEKILIKAGELSWMKKMNVLKKEKKNKKWID